MSYAKLKVAELKAECEKLGLDATGTKPVLVARLEAHSKGDAAAEEEEEEEVKPKKGAKPKAKAAPKKKAAGKRKKEDEEEEEEEAKDEPLDVKKELAKKAKAAGKPSGPRKKDPGCHMSGDVYQDYQATLNQTNIGNNNNKYYIAEVHSVGGGFRLWTHWGRVGEPGQNKAEQFGNAAAAIKAFEKKYKDKSGNNWADRDSFVPKSGKYTQLEMAADNDDEDEIIEKLEKLDEGARATAPKYAKSKLDKKTQELVSLIFSHDMFKESMAKLNIDTAKMPLGKLSSAQILKGYETLEELEKAIENGKSGEITRLTEQFYTQIPHSFGRSVPPKINTIEQVQQKYDMLNILGDVATALASEKESKKGAQTGGEVPNPLDASYATLNCDLTPLDPKSKEWKIIQEYTKNTAGGWRVPKIEEIFIVNRHDEGKRFKAHDSIDHRKLLWHGTNVAVVAAICKTGLRIMPHSGGRVGKGIYSASENGKSAGYVGTTGDGTGIMFLNEVVLGKEHHITQDNSSLVKAPAGHHSIVAQGETDPDPKDDVTLQFDGHDVVVPKGKPIHRPQYAHSSFSQSEFLVYQESQVRMRYLLRCKF